MRPTLVGHVPAYLFFLVLGIGLGVATVRDSARRLDSSFSRGTRARLVVSAVVFGLLGAKLDSVIERGSAESLWWELGSGYRYPGGIIAVAVMLFILRRFRGADESLRGFGDAIAPAAAFAMSVVRIGCFLGGCCYGGLSSLPWAVAFPAGSLAWQEQVSSGLIRADAPAALPVHPLQLYFAVWSLVLGVFLLWLLPRRTYVGQALLVYLALDNWAKFSLEFLRDPPVPHLRWMSLAIAVVASALLTIRWAQTSRESTAPPMPITQAPATALFRIRTRALRHS